jgi:phosphatidylinositol alpha-1,6-mannosyltransferase
MRHLFVTNDFPPKLGGIESYLTNLCKGFDPSDVAVVAPAREGHEAADEALPYEVVRLSGSYLRATSTVEKSVIETVRRLDVDAVHYLAALPLGRLGPKIRKATGVPYTVIAHGTGEILLPSRVPLARQALKKVLIEADVVFPVSDFTSAAVSKLTKGRATMSLLPPSVDVDRFSLSVSGADVRTAHNVGGRFLVLFLGRLVKRKGADVLVRAIAALRGAVLIIGGEGPERAGLVRLAKELGISDRVMLPGLLPEQRLPQYYAAADVFCMPCSDRLGGLDTEGFGVVYLEAQASGIPCVAGRCGGSAEAVDDGVSGVVIDDPTPRKVAVTLLDLRKDPGSCAKLGGAGRARVEREFAPRVAAVRLEEAVETVV